MISQTAEQVFIPLTVGGGVQTDDDVNELLRAGADKVSLNSAAVRDPALLAAVRRPVRHPVHGGGDRRQAPSRRRQRLGGRESDAGRTGTGRDAVGWAVEATDVATAPARSC